MGTWIHPSFSSPSQAGPSEIWGAIGGIPALALHRPAVWQNTEPCWPGLPEESGLFVVRVYLGSREAPVWDGEGFMGLFSQPPKLPHQPTAPARRRRHQNQVCDLMTGCWDAFSLNPAHLSLDELKKGENFPEEEMKHCHELRWEGNMGQVLSHLLQGSSVPSSILRQV